MKIERRCEEESEREATNIEAVVEVIKKVEIIIKNYVNLMSFVLN